MVGLYPDHDDTSVGDLDHHNHDSDTVDPFHRSPLSSASGLTVLSALYLTETKGFGRGGIEPSGLRFCGPLPDQ